MSNIGTIYKKEILDIIRERRTIISMIIVPILLFPILTIGFSSFAVEMVEKTQDELFPITIAGKQNAPDIYQYLESSDKLEIVEVDSILAGLESKEIRAALVIPDNFTETLDSPDTASLEIIYNAAETKSDFAADRISSLLSDYREELVAANLESNGLSTAILKPFWIHRQNIAEDKMGTFLLSLFLPYMIIILSMIGAMYTAIDLNAGEKERGTLETILVTPVPRWQLATGKFLTILTTSLISTFLSIASMTLTVGFGIFSSGDLSAQLGLNVTPAMMLVILLIMIPTAALFSALLMAISIIAKSYKEAQSYISPLMFVVIIPAMISFLPGIELNTKLAFIPIVNISLVIKEALLGSVPWQYIVIIFLSTAIYAAFTIFVCHRLYEKEGVIFRS